MPVCQAPGEGALRDGYTALKCYPLAYPDAPGLRHVSLRAVDRDFANLAFEKVKALRAAVGPDVEIMLDLSGALTTDETIRCAAASKNSTFCGSRSRLIHSTSGLSKRFPTR